MAIRLIDSIDYDFSNSTASTHQEIALRALAFDDNVHWYISGHSGPSSPWAKGCRPASGASTLPASATDFIG